MQADFSIKGLAGFRIPEGLFLALSESTEPNHLSRNRTEGVETR